MIDINPSDWLMHPNQALINSNKKPILKNKTNNKVNSNNDQKDNLMQLNNMHVQLNTIRQNLQPMIDQYQKQNYLTDRNQPYCELMEKATGRLLKVQSENLIELLIDDLLIELVGFLNAKEQEKHYTQNLDVLADYCRDMLVDVGDIDVIQRQNHLGNLQNGPRTKEDFKSLSNGTHYTGNFDNMHNVHLNNLEVKDAQDSLAFQKQLKSMAENYGITQDLQSGYSLAKIKETKNTYKTARFLDDGPYQIQEDHSGSSKSEIYLHMDPQDTMLIVRNQIMAEDQRNKVQYLRGNYCEGMEVLGDKLIEEILLEVLDELGKAQDAFVNEVIKSELN